MTDQNIKTVLGEDGVLLATIDMPGRSMNVFSFEMMDSLERLVDYVNSDDRIKAVVINSAKRAFIAGADLVMVRRFTEQAKTESHEVLADTCGRLGRIFRRLERSTKPYVTAVDGLALGGGLELCLACHARIVSDRRGVLLGLPEIKLGLLPGAGGTQRLPRVVGARLGLEMLLNGTAVNAKSALECGLVDAVVPAAELIDVALQKAAALGSVVKPWDHDASGFDSGALELDRSGAIDRIIAALGLSEQTVSRYPAFRAIMDCVLEGWNKPIDTGLNNEMDIFVRLIKDPVAGNMIRSLFIDRQRSLKALQDVGESGEVKIGVVGEGADTLASMLTAARAPVVAAQALSGEDVVLVTGSSPAASAATAVCVLGGSARAGNVIAGCHAGVWIGPANDHGHAVEVVSDGEPSARAAALRVAGWLRAGAVLLTEGKVSKLAELSAVGSTQPNDDDRCLAVTLAAARMWLAGEVADCALFDSACVVGGVVPSYSGGPFSYLREHGERALQARALALGMGWPAGLVRFFDGAARGD